jgi:hypothetical protein
MLSIFKLNQWKQMENWSEKMRILLDKLVGSNFSYEFQKEVIINLWEAKTIMIN